MRENEEINHEIKSKDRFKAGLAKLRTRVKAEQEIENAHLASESRTRGPLEYLGEPDAAWTVELARSWLPPSSTVAKDFFENRWRIRHPFGAVSRSWRLHGFKHSLILALQLTWTAFTQHTDIVCTIPHLADAGHDAAPDGAAAGPAPRGRGRGRRGRGGVGGRRGRGGRGGVADPGGALAAPAAEAAEVAEASQSHSDSSDSSDSSANSSADGSDSSSDADS